jgi:glucosamine--fructose-6-phosphate aminotransferase (isomerizing)
MCGIVGYIGHRDAYSVIVGGLQKLEYRGYDSAGIALFDGKQLKVSKTKGKVQDLKLKAQEDEQHNRQLLVLGIRAGQHTVSQTI